MACRFEFQGEAEVLDAQATQDRIYSLCSDLSERKADSLASDMLRRFGAAMQEEEAYMEGRAGEAEPLEGSEGSGERGNAACGAGEDGA